MKSTEQLNLAEIRPARKKIDLFYPILFVVLVLPAAFHLIFGLSFAPVLSNSMKPVYSAGDLLITKSTFAADIKVGQIVVLPDLVQNVNYSHRVSAVSVHGVQVTFTTKGDANPSADEHPVTISQLTKVPLVVGHMKTLGWPIVFYLHHNRPGLGLFLLGLAVLLGVARFLIIQWGSRKRS